MVKCDNCPCLHVDDLNEWCGISEHTTCWDKNNPGLSINLMPEKDCPLKRMELKDGTTYVPEIVGD